MTASSSNSTRWTAAAATDDVVHSFRVRAVLLPMEEPHRTASGVVTASPLVLTDLRTEQGVTGHSLIFTYTPAALAAAAELVRSIGETVVGSPADPLALHELLTRRFRLLGTQGLVGMAIAAIDMAAWDARSRARETSLVRLLGGTPRPLRAYGAIGYDGADAAARTAAKWADLGFGGVKAKIGYPTVEEDLAVVRAIRREVGPQLAVMVDYNQSLSPAEAMQRLRALDGEGLEWIEEPTLAHDFAGHAAISRAIRTPIQCGENWWGPLDLRHALEANASDLVMLDVMKIGGVTGWIRGESLARDFGIPVSNHLWPEISSQLLCCTPTANWLEYADWWNGVLLDPLRIENGVAVLDSVVGTGIEWDEEKLGRLDV